MTVETTTPTITDTVVAEKGKGPDTTPAAGSGATPGAGTDPDAGDDPDKGDKTFTQEQVNQVVTDRIAREQAKWQKQIDAQVEQKIKETQRLSELSDEDRAKETLTQRERDLAEREAAIQKKEMLSETESVLRTQKLPASFAPFLVSEDNETTLANIKAFKSAFADAVKVEVKNNLSGKTPDATAGNNKTWTRAEIAKVKDPKERLRLIEENEDLYNTKK